MEKINKDEAAFHTNLMKWLGYNNHLFPQSFLIETKIVRRTDNAFSFKELSPKEERLLLQAKNKRVIQTHSDYGGMGTNCDGSVISGGGFIFLQWYHQGKKGYFYVIDIEDFVREKHISHRKSLTEERAEIIGTKYKLLTLY